MAVPAANAMARILKAEGISWVSTYPVAGMNNAFGQEGLDIFMMRDDRYAIALADAFSRMTNGNQIGVCTVMGGINPVGLQVGHGALAQAYEDGSPVLCITDGIPLGSSGTNRYDMDAALEPVTKWIGHIDRPERTPEIMRRAFTLLRTGRLGPVVVTIPRVRPGDAPFDYDEDEYPYRPVKGWKTAPDPADVQAAVKALLGAKKPIINAGEGVLYAGAAEELRTLAELLQLPVISTLKSKSVFPENHELSVGTRGEPATHFLNECDLVLAVGTSLLRGHFRNGIPNPEEKTVIQCVVNEDDINRYFESNLAVIGDAKFTLQALIDGVKAETGGDGKKNPEVIAEIKGQQDELAAKYGPLMESDDTPINPYRVYGDLMKALDPNNSFVTHDSGNTRDQLSTVYKAMIPRGFSGWGNMSTLGFGLPVAMGAKLAYPERQCVNVTGDAGVSYMLGNFEPLVRRKIGVTTIHISNDGFAGYGPGFWGGGHDPYTWEVSGHEEIDMAASVGAMGYYSERVFDPAEVIPAIKRALEQNEAGKPAYLEIICSKWPVFGAFVP